MRKIFLAVNLLLMGLLVSGCSSSQSNMVLNGVVETSIYSHYSEVPGKIIELPVELGQEVKAGDLIAVLDNSDAKYSLEQLETTLTKKQAALTDLQTSIDPAAIRQAQNNVALAQKAYESSQILNKRDQQAYDRTQQLFNSGAISQTSRDEAQYQADLARIDLSAKQTQIDNARQSLTLLQKGVTQAKITAAQADIQQTQSQLRQLQANLAKYKITALSAGTVISKNFLPGSLVAAGANLVDIASSSEKYLVAYLPKGNLPSINYGQELTIKVGDKQYKGTVSFIDVKAQYTPKDMQTAANKNQESVKIKVRLAQDNPLKPSEKAELIIHK